MRSKRKVRRGWCLKFFFFFLLSTWQNMRFLMLQISEIFSSTTFQLYGHYKGGKITVSFSFSFSPPPCFLGPHLWHMEVPRLGVEWELQLPACATATQHLSRVCDNARSLTHSARPGIEPATPWFLVRFTSAVPQWELLLYFLNQVNS